MMIDQLMMAVPSLPFTQQSYWLYEWEIDELVSEGSKYWEEHKSTPGIDAMKKRSRENEAQAPSGLDGLGAFSVLELNF